MGDEWAFLQAILAAPADDVSRLVYAEHGPDAAALRSPEFEGRVGEVLSYLRRSVEESSLVAAYTLRSGHPFYPVMWDFAYLLVKTHCAVVFIGASSD